LVSNKIAFARIF